MSQDFKTFLIILAISPILLIAAVYQLGERNREQAKEQQQEAEAKAAKYSALSPEEKLREKVPELVEYRHGQTLDGLEALQLTIQHDYVGFFTTLPEELNSAAARHIRAAYQSHPTLKTLDIDYHIKVSDPYGAESYTPGLRIQMDQPNYDRIKWDKFLSKNIPKVTTNYQPLHHEAMP
jgi:hypothetical protein